MSNDKMLTAERIARLREVMRRESLSAFIFTTSDPHQSEYTADHWKGREFISGFNGSAGTAVVTMKSAALWTDSRYFIAAAQQLEGTEFQLMKEKVEGTPTIAEWIGKACSDPQSPFEVGIDGMCSSVNEVKQMVSDLRHAGGFTLRTNFDPLRQIWADRPPLPDNPVEQFPVEWAGETCTSKLRRIRQALHRQHADGMLMARLDDIAWTLNLRGADVHCNPVFVSYLLVTSTGATLYINKVKLPAVIVAYLKAEGIEIDDYANVKEGLKRFFEQSILMDPDEVSYSLYNTLRQYNPGTRSAVQIIEAASPVPAMKAVKTASEQAGFRQAMLADGLAMVELLRWLDEEADIEHETELSVSRKLEQLRAAQDGYRGPSFDTISAYAEHGAIVHYEPTAETDKPLQRRGLLLLDSGGHYTAGTTDITRTITLGPLTDEERRVYTLVLKGHLRLQNLCFPDGASGTQLDAVARSPLWAEGLNYLHGTGHGVGCRLCVHEGPHQIRMEWRPAPLHAGMTVTDEPGIYLEGRFGVRIENTLLVVNDDGKEGRRFLRFEPLTLCPIDMRPVMPELLNDEERSWLSDYHERVFKELSPHLPPASRQWLRRIMN